MNTDQQVLHLKKMIQIARRQLGLDEGTYRAMLQEMTGKDSTTQMTLSELECVKKRLMQAGFNVQPSEKTVKKFGARPRGAQDKHALTAKIEALLTESGRAWNYAHGCAKRMFGIDRVEWCSPDQLWRIVAALEKDKTRRIKREAQNPAS